MRIWHRIAARGTALALLALMSAAPLQANAQQPTARPAVPVLTGAEEVAASGLSGTVGFVVMDIATGEIVEAVNPDLPLPPASVAKAVTAFYALDALGADHRFETRLVASGKKQGGQLMGDLILQGGGDPETDTVALANLAARLKGAGVTSVSGRFLVDRGLLPAIRHIDATQPNHVNYNPAIGALNLNFNRVWVEWRRAQNAYQVKVEARADGLSLPSAHASLEVVERTQSGSIYDYSEDAGAERWRVLRRAAGKAGARHLPVRSPDLFAGAVFRTAAARAGLRLVPPSRGVVPIGATILAREQSRALHHILTDMLRFSTNMTAETVGLAATLARGGTADTLETSAAAMDAWAAQQAGFKPGDIGFDLKNHSGLSHGSRMSARRLAGLLRVAADRRFSSSDAGEALTLSGLMREHGYEEKGAPLPPFAAHVRAKTGTLNFVSGLGGYIEMENGRQMAFAIFAADAARRAGDTSEAPAGGRAWTNRARRLQRALLRSWITRFGGGADLN